MHIESGPTRERKVRNLLMLSMVAVFSVWFAYDGFLGYAKQNKEEHIKQLDAKDREKAASAPVYATVTAEVLPKANEALRKFDRAAQQAALEEVIGGPPSFKTEDAWYYFGPAFRIKVMIEDGKLQKLGGRASAHTATDIAGQKGFAAGLGVFALFLAWNFWRITRTHLVLNDAGLTYQGNGPIRWDDMKALDTEAFAKKGKVDLIYDDNGTERYVRLDEYHLARFDDVIDALCERKGFENPIPVDQKGPESVQQGEGVDPTENPPPQTPEA